MAKTLRDLYPSIRNRQEILQDIMDTPELKETFMSWEEKHQNHFLDFCSGVKGVKILYDGFFKEILNPDTKPQRLEELLSLLLNEEIKILHALPNESSSLSVEDSLLIMDIVIQLSDGSIANVECQRIGFHFTGQRAACYSADLLIRQLKRVRDEKRNQGEKFNYKDIKKVYSIIFYEKSPTQFKKYPHDMTHHFQQISNTGLELDLLQEYCFVPLDIINQIYQNKNVTDNKLEAWLIFLSNDNPEIIQKLISEYPEFELMYQEVFRLCQNTKQVINMFSEELKILDRNTMEYMIDELSAEKEQLSADIDQLSAEKEQLSADNEQLSAENEQLSTENEQLSTENEQLSADIEKLSSEKEQLSLKNEQLSSENELLRKKLAELQK